MHTRFCVLAIVTMKITYLLSCNIMKSDGNLHFGAKYCLHVQFRRVVTNYLQKSISIPSHVWLQ